MSVRESLRQGRTLLLAALAICALATTAFSQALDSPTLVLKRAGFFRIDIDVQAGASGAPNGFTVQWMKKADFDAFGWPADEYSPIAFYCDFTGEPTLNVDTRSSSYQLGPNGVIGVQMGDLFDETGLYGSYLDQVPPGQYVFRAWAEGNPTAGVASSAPSLILTAATLPAECTQGFWKTHPSAWPLGCLPMTLGTVSYTQAQLLAIFNTPAGGNGLISLAHQLIATKLNVCNGSNPVNIQADINAADALIGALVIPPVGAGFLAPGTTSGTTQNLDDFNNGFIVGVVNCTGTVPARHSTWGRVKSLYR